MSDSLPLRSVPFFGAVNNTNVYDSQFTLNAVPNCEQMDGDYNVSNSDIIKLSAMEMYPKYIPNGSDKVMLTPIIGYTTVFGSSPNTSTNIDLLPIEVDGIYGDMGKNLPFLTPIIINGETYCKLNSAYSMLWKV